MITDLWIENFKGIGKRQHIPLRPITLLFGANSAGKSTVLHALLYLREILTNRNFDPKGHIAGFETITFGGFDRLVHRIDRDQRAEAVSFAIKFSVDKSQLMRTVSLLDSVNTEQPISSLFADDIIHWVEEVLNDVGSATVQLTLTRPRNEVRCVQYTLSVDDLPLLRLQGELDIQGEANFDHPVLAGLRFLGDVPSGRIHAAVEALDAGGFLTNVADSTIGHSHGVWHLIDAPADSSSCEFEGEVGRLDPSFWNTAGLHVTDTGHQTWIVPGPVFRRALQGRSSDEVRTISEDNITDAVEDGVLIRIIEDVTVGCAVFTARSQEYATELARSFLAATHAPLGWCGFTLESAVDAIPPINERFPINWQFPAHIESAIKAIRAEQQDRFNKRRRLEDLTATPMSTDEQLNRELTNAIVDLLFRAPPTLLSSALARWTYVGPKRATVPRELTTHNAERLKEWGNGLGAWGTLLDNDFSYWDQCSLLLGDPQWLDSGYELHKEYYKEVTIATSRGSARTRSEEARADSLDHLPQLVRVSLLHKKSGTLLHPQEVGEGVTQVVPIITALCQNIWDHKPTIAAFEQPELHLHPALAARLGDVFIWACLSRDAQGVRKQVYCLAETHSEHLILRLLRRIRQTTDDQLPKYIPPVQPDDVCVLYVDNFGDGTTIKRLRIDEHGEFIDRWPHGFFRERAEELF